MNRRHFLMQSNAILWMGASSSSLLARPVKGARYKARRMNTQGGDTTAAPLVFDLTAEERWPIRGLDPVLHVGGVAVESYQFVNAENTILRFTCYDPREIQDNAAMFLRYGDDESSRTEFPNFRWNSVSGF